MRDDLPARHLLQGPDASVASREERVHGRPVLHAIAKALRWHTVGAGNLALVTCQCLLSAHLEVPPRVKQHPTVGDALLLRVVEDVDEDLLRRASRCVAEVVVVVRAVVC